jgi:hypothetical protein
MMDKTKRKKLEAKGWKFGSAADFLGLSAEEAMYTDLKSSDSNEVIPSTETEIPAVNIRLTLV